MTSKIPEYVLRMIDDEQSRQGGMFVPQDAGYIRKLEEKAELLTHVENGECVGFIFFYCNDDQKNSSYITLVMTSPSSRKLGVGHALVNYVLNITKRRGFKCCHLEVRKDNAVARRLYESIGFYQVEDRDEKYLMRVDV